MYAPNFDQQLLQELNKRLGQSIRRSIYLHALEEGNWARLDLCRLDLLGEGTGRRFLETLLRQVRWEFTLEGNPLTEIPDLDQEQQLYRKLNTLVIEQNDYRSEYGLRSFGFGFPLLAWRDSKPGPPGASDTENLIVAPLAIWILDIERDLGHKARWRISRNPDDAVIGNRVLASFFLRERALQTPPLYGELLDDDLLSEDELSQWLHAFMYSFNPNISADLYKTYKTELEQAAPVPLPDIAHLKKLPLDTPVILWSGLFGLFRSPKEPLMQDIERLLRPTPEIKAYFGAPPVLQAVRPAFMRHPFAMIETDPSQQRLIQTLAQGHHLIMQGAPGTGKTHTLVGLISNIVSNGARCLVVAEKRASLESMHAQLKAIELGELVALIEDEYADRNALVQSVRDRHQNLGAPTYQPSPGFLRALQSAIGQMQRLQRYYQKLQQPISGNWKWADVVGKWLEVSDGLPDRQALQNAFDPAAFKFTQEELDTVCQILPEGEALFQRIQSLQHPFNALNDRLFQASNVHQAEDELRRTLQNLLQALDAAQRDVLTCLFDYEQELNGIFGEYFSNQFSALSQIEHLVQTHFKTGKHLLHKTTMGNRLLSVFVQTPKGQEEAKQEIIQYFLQLTTEHERQRYFKFDFFDIKRPDATVEDIDKNLKEYQLQLSDWYSNVQNTVHQAVNELAPDRIHPRSSFRNKVAELVRNLDAFERNLANSQLLKVGFRYGSSNLRRRFGDLEALDTNMKQLEARLPEFKDYHLLKYYWNNLSEAQRSAFRGLAALGLPQWYRVFSGWYYGALLKRHADEFLPHEVAYRSTLQQWHQERGEVQQLLRRHTLQLWRAQQADAVRRYNAGNNGQSLLQLYNLRRQAGSAPTPLRELIARDVNLFSSFFPVVLVNPSNCAGLLPLVPELFDVVLFDDAGQLPLEGAAGALLRGKHKIVSGDTYQIPPASVFTHQNPAADGNEQVAPLPPFLLRNTQKPQLTNESLLEFALADSTYREEMLQIHTRSEHPALIDFSNAAFYGNRLIPMPAKSSYLPIELLEVDGVCEEQSNDAESRLIVELLLELVKDYPEDDALPTVGIVAFSLPQRNRILEWIQTRSIQDPIAAQGLMRLHRKGLFVKSFENIQGDECQVLVISTVFGKDASGNFQPEFGWLHSDYGARLLNVIITRACRQVYVVTSVPEAQYGNYAPEIRRRGNTGRGLFYAYLSYCKALTEGKESERRALLELLSEHCTNKTYYDDLDEGESLFELHIRRILLDLQLDDYQLERQGYFAGFRIPLLLKDLSAQPRLALFFDLHPQGRSPEEAFAWDIFLEEHLQRTGLPALRLWSYQWWNDPQAEMQRLQKALTDAGLLSSS